MSTEVVVEMTLDMSGGVVRIVGRVNIAEFTQNLTQPYVVVSNPCVPMYVETELGGEEVFSVEFVELHGGCVDGAVWVRSDRIITFAIAADDVASAYDQFVFDAKASEATLHEQHESVN